MYKKWKGRTHLIRLPLWWQWSFQLEGRFVKPSDSLLDRNCILTKINCWAGFYELLTAAGQFPGKAYLSQVQPPQYVSKAGPCAQISCSVFFISNLLIFYAHLSCHRIFPIWRSMTSIIINRLLPISLFVDLFTMWHAFKILYFLSDQDNDVFRRPCHLSTRHSMGIMGIILCWQGLSCCFRKFHRSPIWPGWSGVRLDLWCCRFGKGELLRNALWGE